MKKNYSWSHISKTLAGVSFLLLLYKLPACQSFFSVKQAMKGYRKNNSFNDTRSPITPEKLCSVTRVICSSEYEAILFSAAFSLAFFAAFRVSELLSLSRAERSGILLSNVQVLEESVKIFLKFSKSSPLGMGSWIYLKKCQEEIICPVRTLRLYMNLRSGLSNLLFIHSDDSPLTGYQFRVILQRGLYHLNLSHLRITTHLFRIRAATKAARICLKYNSIKKIGRWRSDSYKLYIRPL